tara:strand:+ start:29 stop:829 length:801 start_codon:yes stop_codon:yes gene_type:complete
MDILEIYCVTDKKVNFLDNTQYKIGWVGEEETPNNYISCNYKDNIFFKEKYYSELTFHYWYWKNILDLKNKNWIGFCQKRRFWLKKNIDKNIITPSNFNKYFLNEPQKEWNGYDSIICEPIKVNKVKKIKLIKRGFRAIIKEPQILFNEEKQTLKLHFDMHHGHGNLTKAINLINDEDREDFLNYVKTSTSYNPHIMFISKTNIIKEWFNTLFPWLLRCEKVFGFNSLQGYDTQRLYAFLAERYLSFWFKKHTKSLNWPWVVFEDK